MTPQSYATHRRYPTRGYYLPGTAILIFLLSIGNFARPDLFPERLQPALFVMIGGALLLAWFNTSVKILKIQDRAIRAEENFRHYLITGKPLPENLTKGQVVALRYAPDGEFPELAQRALAEGLKGEAIKKSIHQWRPDSYRA